MSTYDNLAQFYVERRADITRFDYNRDIEVPGMLAAIGSVKNLSVLDEGCGFGDHLLRLARDKPKELVGLDSSRELIAFAQQQNVPRTRFFVHDLNDLLLFQDQYFDKVFASLTVFYIKNLEQLVAENHRVLKNGGQFAFSIFHPVLMLMNTSGKGIVGTRRDSKDELKIYGDYFNEGPRKADMGGLGELEIYPRTLQTYFEILRKAGFQIVSYHDLRPVLKAKKYSEKYKLTTTLPTFSVIVAQKPTS